MLFNLHDVMQFITIYQCVLFALFLWLFRSKRRGNVLLALFLFAQAAIPLDNLIMYGTAFRQWAIDFSPNIFYLFGHAYWLEAPLLLLYVRAMIYRDYRIKRSDWLLFLPFVAYVLFEVVNYYRLDYAAKVVILQGYDTFAPPKLTLSVGFLRELFRIVCGILALIELLRYQKRIKDEFADIEKIDLTWLKILVLGFLAVRMDSMFVSTTLISSFAPSLGIDLDFWGLAADYAAMLLVSALIFFSMGHSQVFAGFSQPETKEAEKPEEKPIISPEQISQLETYMKEKKPYLNCLLNLENLSKQLQMSRGNLSQLINRHYQQNFFDFINTYRIDECKRLLSDPANKNQTMLEIMENAGFNSKASFNTFFKKKVGMTPTEFREKLNQTAS
ncbi:AraC family transcriptional regulator [Permianibacter sp. IMCC34836]|nr:AraC family transcriptional regulator [Permianibacter fluminis]